MFLIKYTVLLVLVKLVRMVFDTAHEPVNILPMFLVTVIFQNIVSVLMNLLETLALVFKFDHSICEQLFGLIVHFLDSNDDLDYIS